VADRFVLRLCGDRLQKLNGWMPPQKRLIAVELKVKRVREAMSQALNNFNFAAESYVALPEDLAIRVAAKPARWRSFLDGGVGLLGVTPRSCDIVIRSHRRSWFFDPAIQFYCIEKFWRTYPKGS
jgi:hypothetical protein